MILIDINLLGISQLEALKSLMADPLTAHIPVVVLSANAMPRDIERGMAAGLCANKLNVESPTLVFQLHWVNAQTGEVFSKQIKRAKFLEHFVNKPSCLIGREARGGSKPKNDRQSGHSIS